LPFIHTEADQEKNAREIASKKVRWNGDVRLQTEVAGDYHRIRSLGKWIQTDIGTSIISHEKRGEVIRGTRSPIPMKNPGKRETPKRED